MFIIDDLIVPVLGGAALTWIKDEIQSATEENERKVRDLENTSRRYKRNIANEKANLERIKEKNDLQEQLSLVNLQLENSKKKADEIHLEYERTNNNIKEFDESISKLFKAEDDLKEKMNKIIKDSCYFANGDVTPGNEDKYNDVLARIRLLNTVIQDTIKKRDKIKEEREKIHAVLQECNHITKELNDKKKMIQDRMYRLNSAPNTSGQIPEDAYQATKPAHTETAKEQILRLGTGETAKEQILRLGAGETAKEQILRLESSKTT